MTDKLRAIYDRWVVGDGGSNTYLDFPAFVRAVEDVLEDAGWQPIETAPKDGTRIHLGYSHMKGMDVIAHWDGDDWALSGHGNYATRLHGRSNPDAWMPLPPAPEVG